MTAKKLNSKSQEKTLAVVNDLHNSEVVGNQDKGFSLISLWRTKRKGTETKPIINEFIVDSKNIKEYIQNIALDFAQNSFIPASDAKILIVKLCRKLIITYFPKISDVSFVSVVSDIVDSVYQQYPNDKIAGCTAIINTVQDRKIIEIVGVSEEQEKKILKLLTSKEYMNLSKN